MYSKNAGLFKPKVGSNMNNPNYWVKNFNIRLKGILLFFLEIGSFYNSPRVKQLSFTVFESIQPIFPYLEEYQ